MRSGAHCFEGHYITHHAKRPLRGGYEAIFRIVVEEHFEFITRFNPRGNKSFRKKNTLFTIIEKNTKINRTKNRECIEFTNSDHINLFCAAVRTKVTEFERKGTDAEHKAGKFVYQAKPMEKNHVIRIQCSDRKGLIAGITNCLFQHGHNIMAMKEFVDTATAQFFARLETTGNLLPHTIEEELTVLLPPGARVEIIPPRKKKLVILVTKEYHCLGDLLVRHFFGELHADILAVVGNYSTLAPFTEKFGIPFHEVSHQGISREEFEARLLQAIKAYDPDYLVLAKFMRILSPSFVEQYQERIINIHHSFLPAFVGANPYKQAFERGVKLIGATAHIVNNDLDEGPIITQQIIPVKHDDGVTDMVEAGHEIEKAVLADALKLVLEDRIFVSGNKTIVFT